MKHILALTLGIIAMALWGALAVWIGVNFTEGYHIAFSSIGLFVTTRAIGLWIIKLTSIGE